MYEVPIGTTRWLYSIDLPTLQLFACLLWREADQCRIRILQTTDEAVISDLEQRTELCHELHDEIKGFIAARITQTTPTGSEK
jgi:hypothetical protein